MKRDISEASGFGNFFLGTIVGAPLTLWIPTKVSFREWLEIYVFKDRRDDRVLLLPAIFLAGLLFDLSTGHGYQLSPTELDVTLTKLEGPPRVETILVDAVQFQNINWIRVRKD